MQCALKVADRILVLDQAGILAIGTVPEIKRSKEPLIRDFLEETLALLPPEEQALIRGFVLNRFRGDASLLAPGPEMLQSLTGVPTVATLPMWRGHGLPEEDGVFDDRSTGSGSRCRVAVVAYPHMSNLDEFQPLKNLTGVQLVWARDVAHVQGADWIILPGSKHTSSDLAWLATSALLVLTLISCCCLSTSCCWARTFS